MLRMGQTKVSHLLTGMWADHHPRPPLTISLTVKYLFFYASSQQLTRVDTDKTGQAVTLKRGVPSLSHISYKILYIIQVFTFYYSQSQHFTRMCTISNTSQLLKKQNCFLYFASYNLQIQGAAQAHTCLTLLKLSSFGIRTSLGKRHKRFPKATRLLSFANSSPDSKALHGNFPF